MWMHMLNKTKQKTIENEHTNDLSKFVLLTFKVFNRNMTLLTFQINLNNFKYSYMNRIKLEYITDLLLKQQTTLTSCT